MLDHPIVDLVSAVRQSFERALLERQAVEERFQVDVFLGDLSWETSYSLPGEGQPPRVRADLSLDWPTWSQTAYRSWSIGETPDEMPEVVVEVAMRIQRLAERPTADRVLAVLPAASPELSGEPLERSATTIEEVRGDPDGISGAGRAGAEPGGGTAPAVRWAVEATYEGSIRLDEGQLEDAARIAPVVDELTRWVSSTLVRLADLPLAFLPPDPPDGD
ncbi:MAG: hypothetical protein ACRDY3_08800 [Acidimicrobiales bacterium]